MEPTQKSISLEKNAPSQKSTSSVLSALRWRYATKKFDPAKEVSEADLNELLEATRLAASSFGLQPWKMIVVTDKALREKLREKAWNQPQVTDASHLIVLLARKDLSPAYIKRFILKTASTRNATPESLQGFEKILVEFASGKTPEQITAWSQRQAYIALGTLLLAAAEKRIDACPMEGFDPKGFDELLKVEGYTASVLCPVGYRAEDDKYSKLAKVRFPKSMLVEYR